MGKLKCIINRDSDVGTFLHVKKMVEELYSNDTNYDDCIVILGYNLGKNIDYYRTEYPKKKIIVYQLEQLFNYNTNWFDPKSKSSLIKQRTSHIKKWLDECDEIWDYDLSNKWFLENIGYNKVKFVPLKSCESLKVITNKTTPKYDILFYGSLNKKRFDFLKKLSKKFNLVVIGDNFNVDVVELQQANINILPKDFTINLDEIISNSKIILNLHFYESSIQEQVRLFYLLINNKCVVSEISKKNYFGDLIHEFKDYNELESTITDLLTNDKWSEISKSVSTRFKNRELNNIKLGVSYNSFYNVDVLKKSIESVINIADYICVVHQKKSFSGEIGSIQNEILLNDLVKNGYISELITYETEVSDKIDGMIDKRNIGLSKCKNANCDYILTLDNDECYNDRYVREEIKLMYENGIDTLYTPIISYYKSDKYYFIEDKLFVPSIYKIDERKYGRRIHSSVLADPARKMVEKKYSISQMYMHHLTYLEKNFKEKINSKILFSVDNSKKSFSHEILENLIKWKPGDKGVVIGNNDNNENILILQDLKVIDKIVNEYDVKNTKKTFSIIIPTFNTDTYLMECIDSIISSVKNLNCEILVGIDNCNKTLDLVNNNTFDDRIKFYFFDKNVGPYIVKNSLSQICNSDYILFFDSDDIIKSELIEDIMTYKNTYDLIKPMYLDFQIDSKYIDRAILLSKTYGEGVFGVKKDIFLKLNGFEGWRCAADSDLMGRLYKNKIKLLHTKRIGFYRRVHKESLTQHPDTNFYSPLRAKYSSISKNKKHHGPLEKLIVEPFRLVNALTSQYEDVKTFVTKEEKIKTLKDGLNFNPSKNSTKINYDKININSKSYNPSKHIKPVRENVPVNRNELFELKKGTLAEQNKQFFPMKRKLDL